MPALTRRIDVLAVVASPDGVKSPFAGICGAVVRVEVLQDRGPPEPQVVIGAMTLGDVLVLETPDGERFQLVVGHTTLALGDDDSPLVPLGANVPAELVHVLATASSRGALYAREHVIRHGDTVRLEATVEADGKIRGDLRHVVSRTVRHEC